VTFGGGALLQVVEEEGLWQSAYSEYDAQDPWFFQASQFSMEQKSSEEPLLVRTISGIVVAILSPRGREDGLSLKKRIFAKEGTAVFMQKIVQEGKILSDADIVSRDPLVLVRMPRKRMLIASLDADLRAYDLETGAAMRVVPAHSFRLSCMVADWENARCFTGSADGVVRVWDVHSCECLGAFIGIDDKISAIASDLQDHLLAVSVSGTLRIWVLEEKDSGAVIPTDFQEWEIGLSGKVAVSVDWERSLALVSGESRELQDLVVAYHLQTQQRLWSWHLPGTTPVLVFDWAAQQCLLAPGSQFLQLRGMGPSSEKAPAQFAHHRLHRKGLVSVDWYNACVVFIAEPFALELWSLNSFEMLHSMRDASGDGLEIISLDVDWSQSVPRAITCRTYIDWELVAGEVCIQQWEMQEGGDTKYVTADHPLIGGFDIMAATAQF